jgi:hypothetical protein
MGWQLGASARGRFHGLRKLGRMGRRKRYERGVAEIEAARHGHADRRMRIDEIAGPIQDIGDDGAGGRFVGHAGAKFLADRFERGFGNGKASGLRERSEKRGGFLSITIERREQQTLKI